MDLVADGPDRWRLPKHGGMRVDGLVFASENLIAKAREDRAVDQVANVAHLPGIVGYSIAMPDIHWGYGFPIGGVAATDVDDGGVVSPGGVGFDIGCGVRLLRTDLSESEVTPRLTELASALSKNIPAGVGGKGLRRLDRSEAERVLYEGARWAVAQGIGNDEDVFLTEDPGGHEGADVEAVSDKAYQRGASQLGSLGGGNHFIEVQKVDETFHPDAAESMGLERGQVCIMIHSGSRGLGHQVCTETLRMVESAMVRRGIEVPDRQLACVPVSDPEGQRYLGAMAAAANFARANRHVLADGVRRTFGEIFGDPAVDVVYDVSHNVAKLEDYDVAGRRRTLCVHRKGATRAFGPNPGLPEPYRAIGQPVLVPGSMGTASWVALGTAESAQLSFGSTCHGAGRTMSRKAATKKMSGHQLRDQLRSQGILVKANQIRQLAEEAPYAYKDVDEVIEVCNRIGLSKKVARLKPMVVVKG